MVPAGIEIFPFAVLGFLLGRLYLALGAAVARSDHRADPHRARDVRVVHAREGVARRDRAACSSARSRRRTVTPPVTPSASPTYAGYIGEELDFMPARMERLRFAALMHDIGKLVVPNQLLNKPGKLTEDEFAQVRVHEKVACRC